MPAPISSYSPKLIHLSIGVFCIEKQFSLVLKAVHDGQALLALKQKTTVAIAFISFSLVRYSTNTQHISSTVFSKKFITYLVRDHSNFKMQSHNVVHYILLMKESSVQDGTSAHSAIDEPKYVFYFVSFHQVSEESVDQSVSQSVIRKLQLIFKNSVAAF